MHNLCECGCGWRVRSQKARFLPGHNSKVAHPMEGRRHTEEAKKRMSTVKLARAAGNKQSSSDGPLCACGCGGRARLGNRYIYTHHRTGTSLSEEHRAAIGRGSARAWANPYTRLGSEEHRAKLRTAMLGREITWKDKLAKAQTGKRATEDVRRKMSLSHGGDGSLTYTKRSRPGWKRRREEIRKRDGYICQECGEPQVPGQRKHHVHHINYDLDDLRSENLITLCRPCHGRTGAETVRKFYQERYTDMLTAREIR